MKLSPSRWYERFHSNSAGLNSYKSFLKPTWREKDLSTARLQAKAAEKAESDRSSSSLKFLVHLPNYSYLLSNSLHFSSLLLILSKPLLAPMISIVLRDGTLSKISALAYRSSNLATLHKSSALTKKSPLSAVFPQVEPTCLGNLL